MSEKTLLRTIKRENLRMDKPSIDYIVEYKI